MIKSGEKALVADIHRAKATLRNINWNFYSRHTFVSGGLHPFNCRKYHWYPATFVPEIPFTLIEVLTTPGAMVYDPFAGIGTTYFQALLLDRKALATENCRVAVEYMRSLLILFKSGINFEALYENIQKSLTDFCAHKDYISSVHGGILIDKLRPWYAEETLNRLSFLFIKKAACRSRAKRAAMHISISASLNTLSSQNRGWGCIADNMLPKENQIRNKDVFGLFSTHINRLFKDISEHLRCTKSDYDQLYDKLVTTKSIFHKDVRDCNEIPDNCVDLVVTSPPYPNMTDYVTSQRLVYYLLGFDLADRDKLEEIDLEIGARSRRRRINSLDQYLNDMRLANEVISQKIKSGGYACYVMPVFNTDNDNNKNRRRVVQRVLSSMDKNDLIKEDEYERILPTKRRSHNMKWATLEREKIYLFKKV